MTEHYGTTRIKDFILILVVVLITLVVGNDFTFLINFIIFNTIVVVLLFFMSPTYRITMYDKKMKIYSFFDRKRTIHFDEIDSVVFEGIEIKSRVRLISLYMTFKSDNRNVLTVSVLNFAKKSFYNDLVRKASLNNFKLIFDEPAKALIQEYLE